MKKRILSVLLSLSMSVCMLSGCGLKKDDVISNVVEKIEDEIKITKKLEEEYVERMGLYQEYFKQVKTEYSDYEIGGTITIDSKGLPLMWLVFDNSGTQSTQLIGIDKDEVKVLAERREAIYPYRGKLIMGLGQSNVEDVDSKTYLYDEEKQDFITVTDLVEPKEDGDYIIYSEKELEEKIDYVSSLVSSMNHIYDIFVGVNKSESKVAYFGTFYPSKMYDDVQALIKLGVFGSFYDNSSFMLFLKKEYADNKVAKKYFDKLQDANLSKNELSSILDEYESEMNGDTIKLMPEGVFILPDGSQCSGEDAEKNMNIISNITSDEWDRWIYEAGEFFEDFDFERIMRELEKNPIYTQEELFVYLVSIAYNCDIVELDLNDYVLSKLSNKKIADEIESYFYGSYNEYNFTDDLNDNRSALLETEPYKTIHENHIDNISFADNIATLTCYNNNEYQFQVEFTEAGDKISKIEYIDPYANLPEWKKQYIAYVEEKNVEMEGNFSLVNIDKDNIPELIYSNGLSVCLLGFKNNEIQDLGEYYNSCLKVFDDYLYISDYYMQGLYNYKNNELRPLFYAEWDRELGCYIRDGKELSWEDCMKKIKKITGVDIESISYISFDYDLDSIKQAIIEY